MTQIMPPNRSRRQWEALAKARISKGEYGSYIEADFVRQGLEPSFAKLLVDSALSNAKTKALWLLLGGLGAAAVGFFITVVTFLIAISTPGDNNFFIWFGPMIVGTIVAIVGLVRLLSIHR